MEGRSTLCLELRGGGPSPSSTGTLGIGTGVSRIGVGAATLLFGTMSGALLGGPPPPPLPPPPGIEPGPIMGELDPFLRCELFEELRGKFCPVLFILIVVGLLAPFACGPFGASDVWFDRSDLVD